MIAPQSRFLPWLVDKLPVSVPVPELLDDHVLRYRKLPGVVLSPEFVEKQGPERISRQIAELIAALQALPVEECIDVGITPERRTDVLLRALDRTLPALSQRARKDVKSWRDQFTVQECAAVLIHGDLWYENILVDPVAGRISAVLDFDTMSIGDPAWDLATQLHLGEKFARLVWERMPHPREDLWTRARSLFQLRCFEGLDLAIRRKDEVEFDESIAKLRSAGVLSHMG